MRPSSSPCANSAVGRKAASKPYQGNTRSQEFQVSPALKAKEKLKNMKVGAVGISNYSKSSKQDILSRL